MRVNLAKELSLRQGIAWQFRDVFVLDAVSAAHLPNFIQFLNNGIADIQKLNKSCSRLDN